MEVLGFWHVLGFGSSVIVHEILLSNPPRNKDFTCKTIGLTSEVREFCLFQSQLFNNNNIILTLLRFLEFFLGYSEASTSDAEQCLNPCVCLL